MRINGKVSHCVVEPRAGQRKAARGKEGARTSVSAVGCGGLSMPLVTFLGFRRGLRGEGLGAAIVSRWRMSFAAA